MDTTLACGKISMAAFAFHRLITTDVSTTLAPTPWICIVFGLFTIFGTAVAESEPPQATYTKQSPEPPPPPPPPVTPVVREYNWPKNANTSATFSIVTTNSLAESDQPQSSHTSQSPEPSPPSPPPVTPVLHEYSWPKDVNTSATFSIVTTSGTVYLATMVWVQEWQPSFQFGGWRRARDTTLFPFRSHLLRLRMRKRT